MGSTGSKACTGRVSSFPSSSSAERKGKRRRNRLFQSSCLGGSSGSRNDNKNVGEHASKENEGNVAESGQVKVECYGKLKVEEPESNRVISNVMLDEWNQASITNNVSRTGSSSARALSTSASTSQSSFLSRFNFLPGNMSFRLSRTASLGSSRAYGIPSCSPQILNNEEVHQTSSSNNISAGNETQQTSDLLPTAETQNHESFSASLQHHYRESDSLDNNLHNNSTTLGYSGDGNGSSTKVEVGGTSHSPRMNSNSDGFETRISERRNGAQETVEHNVCFSRTLSVGRLRDRVLRRSSVSDATFCPLQQETQVRDSLLGSGTETLTSEMRMSESEHLGLLSPTTSGYAPGTSSSTLSFHNQEVETARSRDTRYHDLLEHRSNFVERRRRIRSQVRALQRLGSRFENLSGHERSCILSGHHRAGRCTCRLTNRDANLNDDTSARASISRIVMLAEALFEVLDEIHQQSVVLSSQPSISALGSVPAPNDVVESLPVKLYNKPQKHQNEDAAQCYICLVEYEEGDIMRVLPCRHEFHRTCIDKWLKEIHRVCPLCRGDICRSGTLAADG